MKATTFGSLFRKVALAYTGTIKVKLVLEDDDDEQEVCCTLCFCAQLTHSFYQLGSWSYDVGNSSKGISAKLYNIIEDYTNLKTPDGKSDDVEADCTEVLEAVWNIGTKNKSKVERKAMLAELEKVEEEERKAKEKRKELKSQLQLLDAQLEQ